MRRPVTVEREFEEGRVLDVAHATILCWGSAARRDGRPAPSSGDRDRPAHRPPPPGEASRWIGVTTWSRSSRPAAGLRRAAGGRGACFAARPPNCQQDRGRVRARHSTTRPSTPRSDVGGARAQAVGAATAGRRPRRAASAHGRPPGRGTRRLLVRKARRSSPGGCGQARAAFGRPTGGGSAHAHNWARASHGRISWHNPALPGPPPGPGPVQLSAAHPTESYWCPRLLRSQRRYSSE